MPAENFTGRVTQLVERIPEGRVMTYGQIAAMCGSASSARIVGGIAHFGNPALPWHRVVNRNGGLASGYPGGRESHKKHLESEGIKVNEEFRIKLQDYIWQPKNK